MKLKAVLEWPDGKTAAEVSRSIPNRDDALRHFKFLKWALNGASEDRIKKKLFALEKGQKASAAYTNK